MDKKRHGIFKKMFNNLKDINILMASLQFKKLLSKSKNAIRIIFSFIGFLIFCESFISTCEIICSFVAIDSGKFMFGKVFSELAEKKL